MPVQDTVTVGVAKRLYYGLSGGILAHANGLTLSQPLGDTLILVRAPGASDTRIENQTGVSTDWRGYAVLPYATDYRENRVALDTNTLADNVDIENTRSQRRAHAWCRCAG